MEVAKKSSTDLFLSSSAAVSQALWITGFTLLTVLGAKVEIPHYPVPYTLQTFFVLLSGAFLGSRNGALSQLFYLSLGALGLPVFAGNEAGLLKLFGPSAGYLLSFPIAAATIGYLVHQRKGYAWMVFSFFVGLGIIFISGSLFLQATLFHDWNKTIMSGLLIFSWWDLLKLSAASAIYNEFSKRFKKLPK